MFGLSLGLLLGSKPRSIGILVKDLPRRGSRVTIGVWDQGHNETGVKVIGSLIAQMGAV